MERERERERERGREREKQKEEPERENCLHIDWFLFFNMYNCIPYRKFRRVWIGTSRGQGPPKNTATPRGSRPTRRMEKRTALSPSPSLAPSSCTWTNGSEPCIMHRVSLMQHNRSVLPNITGQSYATFKCMSYEGKFLQNPKG